MKTMKNLSIILALSTACVYFSSCGKSDVKNPDPQTIDSTTIMGFKDSTQLIKSMKVISRTGDNTFVTFGYVSYDTLNKKIIFSDEAGHMIEEYEFNDKGLVVARSWVEEGSGDTYTISYLYDESNVLQTVIHPNGIDNEIINITKMSISSDKYQLQWEEFFHYADPNIKKSFRAVIDSKQNRLLSYEVDGNGEHLISDTILYDASGNVSKVITLRPNIAVDPFTSFNFTERDTRGDQLYNFYSIVYNGTIPINMVSSQISSGTFQSIFFQFYKYPALATEATYWDGNDLRTIHSNSEPQYDSKGRLAKIRLYYLNPDFDADDYQELTISYYKD